MEEKKKDALSVKFEQEAVRVSKVSIWGNLVLSLLKLLAGIFAHSQAMVSDAVHSASDVLSSIVVIIGVKLSRKEADEEHPYGHERMESVAAVVLAVILAITGFFIGHTAIEKLTAGTYEHLQAPGILAAMAAVISILCKEAMYWYTRHYAKALSSDALMADAWHHRSDALSSVGSLIGIVGARMGYAFLDPAASLVICLFILKTAIDIFRGAIKKMVDHASSREKEEALCDFVKRMDGVLGIEKIQTREFGSRVYVDLILLADGEISLRESTKIANHVHDAIENAFPEIKHISVLMKAAD